MLPAWYTLICKWALQLGLRLLAERARGPASPWHNYVRTLPLEIAVPLFFRPDEVAALQYPPLVHQVRFLRVRRLSLPIQAALLNCR